MGQCKHNMTTFSRRAIEEKSVINVLRTMQHVIASGLTEFGGGALTRAKEMVGPTVPGASWALIRATHRYGELEPLELCEAAAHLVAEEGL